MSPRKARLSQTKTESPAQSWMDIVLLFAVRSPRAARPFPRLAVGKLQDAEEDGAVAAEGEAFLFDADLVLLQDDVEHVHQLDVRNGLERTRDFGRGQSAKFVAADEIGIYVGHELAILHIVSPLGFGWGYRAGGRGEVLTNYSQVRISCPN
jgi:hypothetical protein